MNKDSIVQLDTFKNNTIANHMGMIGDVKVPIIYVECPKCCSENVSVLFGEYTNQVKPYLPKKSTCMDCGYSAWASVWEKAWHKLVGAK